MSNKPDKEAINKKAWQSWEDDQKTNQEPVNPQAYTYGYMHGFKAALGYTVQSYLSASQNEELQKEIDICYRTITVFQNEYRLALKDVLYFAEWCDNNSNKYRHTGDGKWVEYNIGIPTGRIITTGQLFDLFKNQKNE